MSNLKRQLRDLKRKVFDEVLEGRQASDEDLALLDRLAEETGIAEELGDDDKGLSAPTAVKDPPKAPSAGGLGLSPFAKSKSLSRRVEGGHYSEQGEFIPDGKPFLSNGQWRVIQIGTHNNVPATDPNAPKEVSAGKIGPSPYQQALEQTPVHKQNLTEGRKFSSELLKLAREADEDHGLVGIFGDALEENDYPHLASMVKGTEGWGLLTALPVLEAFRGETAESLDDPSLREFIGGIDEETKKKIATRALDHLKTDAWAHWDAWRTRYNDYPQLVEAYQELHRSNTVESVVPSTIAYLELLDDPSVGLHRKEALLKNLRSPLRVLEEIDHQNTEKTKQGQKHLKGRTKSFPFPSRSGKEVLAHIGGASGSGKSTLAAKLKEKHPNLTVKDLDDLDDAAVAILGWTDKPKSDYSDSELRLLADRRQSLLDSFLNESDLPIVLVGHHWEGENTLNIPTKSRFYLDVTPQDAAFRAYIRSQDEGDKTRRSLVEMPEDIEEAEKDLARLQEEGYLPKSEEEIIDWVDGQLKPLGREQVSSNFKVGTSPFAKEEKALSLRDIPPEKLEHKYGCLLAIIPMGPSNEIVNWAKGLVWEQHLGSGGFDQEPHVTIAYGFDGLTPFEIQVLRDIVAGQGEIVLTLGKLALFTDNPDGDVLHIEVESKDLTALNKEICERFPTPGNKQREYKPHLTLCYLHPEHSKQYTEYTGPLSGETITVNTAKWSGPDRKEELIPLYASQVSLDDLIQRKMLDGELPFTYYKDVGKTKRPIGEPFLVQTSRGPRWYVVEPSKTRPGKFHTHPAKAPGPQQQAQTAGVTPPQMTAEATSQPITPPTIEKPSEAKPTETPSQPASETVQTALSEMDEETRQLSSSVFGRELAAQDWYDLSGGMPLDTMEISSEEDDNGVPNIVLNASNNDYLTRVNFYRDPTTGKLISDYGGIRVVDEARGSALAPKVLATQVATMKKKLGVDSIKTLGLKSDKGHIGFKVWPKMGFDGPLTPEQLKGLPPEYHGAKTIQELYAMNGGRKAWEEHGVSAEMSLDLNGPAAERMFALMDRMAGRERAKSLDEESLTLEELVRALQEAYDQQREEERPIPPTGEKALLPKTPVQFRESLLTRKALSAMAETSGGALVAPARQATTDAPESGPVEKRDKLQKKKEIVPSERLARLRRNKTVGPSPFRKSLPSRRVQDGHYTEQGVFVRDGTPFQSASGEWRVIKPGTHDNVPAEDPNAPLEIEFPEVDQSPFDEGSTKPANYLGRANQKFSDELLNIAQESESDPAAMSILHDMLLDEDCPELARRIEENKTFGVLGALNYQNPEKLNDPEAIEEYVNHIDDSERVAKVKDIVRDFHYYMNRDSRTPRVLRQELRQKLEDAQEFGNLDQIIETASQYKGEYDDRFRVHTKHPEQNYVNTSNDLGNQIEVLKAIKRVWEPETETPTPKSLPTASRLRNKSLIGLSPFKKALPPKQVVSGGHYNENNVFVLHGTPFQSESGEWRVIKPDTHRNVPAEDPNKPAENPKNGSENSENTAKTGENSSQEPQIPQVGGTPSAGGIPPSPFGESAPTKTSTETNTRKRFSSDVMTLAKEAKSDEGLVPMLKDTLLDNECDHLAEMIDKGQSKEVIDALNYPEDRDVVEPKVDGGALEEWYSHASDKARDYYWGACRGDLKYNIGRYGDDLAHGGNLDAAEEWRNRTGDFTEQDGRLDSPEALGNLERIVHDFEDTQGVTSRTLDIAIWLNRFRTVQEIEAQTKRTYPYKKLSPYQIKSVIGLSPFRRIKSIEDWVRTKSQSRRTQGGHYDQGGNFVRDGYPFVSQPSGECRVIQPNTHNNVPSAGCGTPGGGIGELVLPKDIKVKLVEGSERAYFRAILGNIEPNLLGAMCNAQDGATLNVLANEYMDGKVDIYVKGNGYNAARSFKKGRDGRLIVTNENFRIADTLSDGSPNPLKGKGFEIFTNQIRALKKAGASKMKTWAAGNKATSQQKDGFNGYYTWPRGGYSAFIGHDVVNQLPDDLREGMGDSDEIRDLFDLPGGKEWWLENGKGLACTFDLTDGSRNMKSLEAYRNERKQRDG